MSLYGKLAGALVSVAIVGCGAAYVISASDEVMAEVSELSNELSYYVIREYNGDIALFKDGSDEPVAIYDLPAEGINAADYELLREGIRLQGLSDVTRLLEDLDIEIP